jgi:hypothetical protein
MGWAVVVLAAMVLVVIVLAVTLLAAMPQAVATEG